MSLQRQPFQQELSRFHDRFARPLVFGKKDTQFRVQGNSATATLLRINDRYFGVTCQHVIQKYRRLKREEQAEFFYVGDALIDPEALLIDESERLDLATFNFESIVGSVPNLMPTNFHEPRAWPPGDVSEGDIVAFAGFPGEWRDQASPVDMQFYQFSQSATVIESVADEHVAVRIALDESTFLVRERELFSFAGGLSGAPAFVWRNDKVLTSELVGFVYEYQPTLDILYIRRARCLSDDGTLLK